MRQTQLLFAYGTLKQEEKQLSVLNRILEGEIDVLEGYRISRKKIMDKYPVVEPSPVPGSFVQGMVYQVSNFELYEIDIYETNAYKRIQVLLRSGLKAWVYIENIE